MTDELSRRRAALQSALGLERSVEEHREELDRFPWDCDEHLATCSADVLAGLYRRVLAGELTPRNLTDWADMLEMRDGVEFEDDEVRDQFFVLANPLINRETDMARVRQFLVALEKRRIGRPAT